MNRGGPCRVAAKASSAALPSCLPAAASCCQLLGSQLAYPGVAGRGQRQEHRYCALPKAPPPAGPIFSGSSSYNTAVCFFSGQMGSNSYGPLHCISLVHVAQCTFPPDPDNRWVASCPLQQIAGWHSRLFLHRRHIFH